MKVVGEEYLKQKGLNTCNRWQISSEIKTEKYPLDFTIRKFLCFFLNFIFGCVGSLLLHTGFL